MKKVLSLIVAAALVASAGGWYWYRNRDAQPTFRTVVVERGDLLATIKATGTVEPEEVIDVGAQVAGKIVGFGQDPRDSAKTIDYRSPVERDTILARIDDSMYRSELEGAEAQLQQAQAQSREAEALVEQAQANIERAEADLQQMQAKFVQAERDWTRAQQLDQQQKGVISRTDFDAAQATYLTTKATLGVGKAAISQSVAAFNGAKSAVAKNQAMVADADASRKRAQINLGYCTIKSPVKGVIIDRRVNVGQTVVSSLNSPSLFLIATDLKRMQVWSSVNEADVGNIRPGQPVKFGVDVAPGRAFRGEVAPDQPRLNASMTQNVVTYTVVVTTDNSDGRLLPYLTANLEFEVSRRQGVLLVPNAALRFQPTPEQVVPEARGEFVQADRRKSDAADDKQTGGERATGRSSRGTLWIEDGRFVRPLHVLVGLTDGIKTEVSGDGLKEDDVVVVGEIRPDANGTSDPSNPFTPQMFRNRKQPQ